MNRNSSHQPPPPWRPITLAGLALILLLTSCAGPRPEGEIISVPGYEGRQEQLYGRDLSPLRQRRIVLDPGHGGFFRGALGPNGLTEAEVNLGVALYLRGLLEWAGAQVWLTRSADTDFLCPADSSLASDLAMRVSLSDSLQPDVFISIHHNSNAALDRTINETQTYYPLDDDGPSLDLARSIHRHLVLNLGITPASIRPGNFHVLRESTVPAVLGEPAMISHAVIAERLSLAASQRLEAEAYFLGLLDYFRSGLPAWSGAATDTLFWGAPEDPTSLTWRFLPAGAGGNRPATPDGGMPGPDPSQIRLTVDGYPVTPHLSPDARNVTWHLPRDLAPVPHVLQLHGRNLAGRATARRRTILLPRTAASLQVTVTIDAYSRRAGLHWRGHRGAPVPAGKLNPGTGREIAAGAGLPAWALLEDLDPRWSGDDITFQATDAAVTDPTCDVVRNHLPPGLRLHLVTHRDKPFAPPHGWRGRLGADGTTPLITRDPTQPLWLEGAGVRPLIDPRPTEPTAARTVTSSASRWETTPLLSGLMGTVIVLDPAGGGVDADGAGPLGLRGADLNLAVARHAAQLLRGAGARVILTRTDETALLPVEKVRLAGRVGADFFLTIGRRQNGEPRSVRHHPGSVVGSRWAQAAIRAGARLPAPDGSRADSCRSQESSAYLLRHTACPALEWRLDRPLTPSQEIRQGDPGWQRAEARAILLAISAVSGHPAVFDHVLQVADVMTELERLGGLPAAQVDWAWLDGNLPWSPLPALHPTGGAAKFVASEQGPGLPALLSQHVLEIHAGQRWQVWLLDRQDSTWRPTLLLGADDARP